MVPGFNPPWKATQESGGDGMNPKSFRLGKYAPGNAARDFFRNVPLPVDWVLSKSGLFWFPKWTTNNSSWSWKRWGWNVAKKNNGSGWPGSVFNPEGTCRSGVPHRCWERWFVYQNQEHTTFAPSPNIAIFDGCWGPCGPGAGGYLLDTFGICWE